jgi:hypothetical protein
MRLLKEYCYNSRWQRKGRNGRRKAGLGDKAGVAAIGENYSGDCVDTKYIHVSSSSNPMMSET